MQPALDAINSELSKVAEQRKILDQEATDLQARHNREVGELQQRMGELNVRNIQLTAKKELLEELIQTK